MLKTEDSLYSLLIDSVLTSLDSQSSDFIDPFFFSHHCLSLPSISRNGIKIKEIEHSPFISWRVLLVRCTKINTKAIDKDLDGIVPFCKLRPLPLKDKLGLSSLKSNIYAIG